MLSSKVWSAELTAHSTITLLSKEGLLPYQMMGTLCSKCPNSPIIMPLQGWL